MKYKDLNFKNNVLFKEEDKIRLIKFISKKNSAFEVEIVGYFWDMKFENLGSFLTTCEQENLIESQCNTDFGMQIWSFTLTEKSKSMYLSND